MPRKKGTNYWGEKQEELVLRWIAASTEKEHLEIYNLLTPSLNHMVGQIMQRYFSVPASRYKELQQDCITHIYMRLKDYYDSQHQKSFSYCGTIARNYLHECMVRIPNTVKTISVEYTDQDYVLDSSQGLDYDKLREYDFQAILKYFDEKADIYRQRLESLEKREKKLKGHKILQSNAVKKKYKDYIMAIGLLQEYIVKYQNINMVSMIEYVFLNSNLKRVRVVNMFSKLLGFSVMIPRDEYITKDEEKAFTMFNDDWTPIQDTFHKRQMKRNQDKKFDAITYF